MNINFTIKRSRKRRKTISLQIVNSSDVTVYAPYYTPLREIQSFVDKKQNWISATLQRQEETQPPEKRYVNGERFYYLGQAYPLEVFFEPFQNAGVVFRDNCFYLNSNSGKEIKKHYFTSWYRKKAREFISRRLQYFCDKLGIQPRDLRITSARTRWGSCSEDNNLSFSLRLIMAPPEAIDYVIVHELMHIREKNHSSKFWQLVIDILPQYKLYRSWLKNNHNLFHL